MLLLLLIYMIYLGFLYWLYNLYNLNSRVQRSFDVFQPQSFFLIFMALELPYLLLVLGDHNNIPFLVLLQIDDFDSVYNMHILNTMIYVTTVMIFLRIFNPNPHFFVKNFKKNIKTTVYFKIHILFLLITIFSYLYFINNIGGFKYLLLNLDSKVTIIQGTGYIQAVYTVASTLSMGFLIVYFSKINKKMSLFQKLYLGFLVLLLFAMFATTGGRKSSILLLAFIFLMWHYNINKIKFITLKNIILFIFILFFFAFMPILRIHGAAEYFLDHPNEAIFKTFENLGLLFRRFSDIDRSLFIYTYFNIDNLWFGKSFIDILYAPIPRMFFPDKPPVDEGVYIYNLLHGINVEPPTPLHKMMVVGLPTSTITNMYLNFWYPGIIVGGILMAYVIKYFFNLCKKTEYSPEAIMLYTSVIFGNFAITNLRIVGFLTLLVFIYLMTFFVTLKYK